MAGIAAMMKSTKLDQRTQVNQRRCGLHAGSTVERRRAFGASGIGSRIAFDQLAEQCAEALAVYLNELNDNRTTIERSIYLSANKQIKKKYDPENDAAFVLGRSCWHPGDHWHRGRPFGRKICATRDHDCAGRIGWGQGTGSAGSALGLDLHGTLVDCSDKLEAFGGHKAAAGLRINTAKLDEFRQSFLRTSSPAHRSRGSRRRTCRSMPKPRWLN